MMKMNFKKNIVELLSPAGSIESFKAACAAQADAIYMGLDKFNARTMAKNFDVDKYIECIEYAHFRGIKVYLTLNTLINESEVDEALELLSKLYSKGLDAVILQDIGLATLIHRLFPDLHMHASTQMSVYSLEQVKLLEKLGFKRVVLARELSISEIEYICSNCDAQIEVFVHGALCVSMSGQCLLSSVIGNRSANKGACAQPCRMKYSLFDSKDKEIYSGKYLLSKKDIYGLEHINRLIKASVTSLKLEGRNKTPEYVYGVTKTYRKYIDYNNENIVDEKDRYILKQLFNRNGLSDGYLSGIKYRDSISELSPKNTGVYLGKVISTHKKYVKVKLEENISLHDGVEIYSKDSVVSNIVTCIKDENGKILNKEIEKGNYVFLGDFKQKVEKGDRIYKTSCYKLNNSLKNDFENNNRQVKYTIDISISSNKPIEVSIIDSNISFSYDYVPQLAKTKALTEADIFNSFSKTLDEPFKFESINIKLDNDLFIPTSILNDLRRTTIEKIKDSIRINNDCSVVDRLDKVKEELFKEAKIDKKIINKDSDTFFVYKYDKKIDYIKEYLNKYGRKPNLIYFNISDYYLNREDILKKYNNKTEIYVYIQNFVGYNLDKIIKENIELFLKDKISGVMIGSFQHFELLKNLKKKYNFKLVADYSFNITNIYSAYSLLNLGFDKITPSVELSIGELKNIISKIPCEVVSDVITVMTSRYCILGSFVGDKTEVSNCKRPCKNLYYLKDLHRSKILYFM